MRALVLLLLVFAAECKREARNGHTGSKSPVTEEAGHASHHHHHHHHSAGSHHSHHDADVALLQQDQSESQSLSVADDSQHGRVVQGDQALVQSAYLIGQDPAASDVTSIFKEIESMKHEIETLKNSNPEADTVAPSEVALPPSTTEPTAPAPVASRHKWAMGAGTKVVSTKAAPLDAPPQVIPREIPAIRTLPAEPIAEAPQVAPHVQEKVADNVGTQNLVETEEGAPIRVINMPASTTPKFVRSPQRKRQGLSVKPIHLGSEANMAQVAQGHRHAWGDGLEIEAELPKPKEILTRSAEVQTISIESRPVEEQSPQAALKTSPRVIELTQPEPQAPPQAQQKESVTTRSVQDLLSLEESAPPTAPSTTTDLSRLLIEKLDSNQAYDLLQKLILSNSKQPTMQAPVPIQFPQTQSPPIVFNMGFGNLAPALPVQAVPATPQIEPKPAPIPASVVEPAKPVVPEQQPVAVEEQPAKQPQQQQPVTAEDSGDVQLLQVDEGQALKEPARVGPGRHLARSQGSTTQSTHRWRV